VVEIIVRIFFTAIFFIMFLLMESYFDFYQFRWLTCLAINQLLILTAVEINPIHSLALVAVVCTPLLNALQVKDLKKVDPHN
jgi:hypothetical protein